MAISPRAQELAQEGEERAARHVASLGWQVLDRNWRCRDGELDLVAHETDTNTLVFIEVKCRSSRRFGHPLEAITDEKESRLWTLAFAWLREQGIWASRIRLDAIGIILPRSGPAELVHLRGLGG